MSEAETKSFVANDCIVNAYPSKEISLHLLVKGEEAGHR